MAWNSRFWPGDMRQFFVQHAERVAWQQAVLCPCGNTPQSPRLLACAACGGVGYCYPNPPQTVQAVITRVTETMALQPSGLWLPGDDLVVDQSPTAVPFAPWDLLMPTWAQGEPFEGQTLVRGTGTTDALFYRVAAPVWCGSIDPATGAATVYEAGVDFTTSGAAIQWLGTANQPAAGTSYSFRYNPEWQWVIFAAPQMRYERGTNLGARAGARKRHLVLQNVPPPLTGA